MQATVLDFDATTGAGSVVTDEGRVLSFGGEAFLAGGLRLLRPGQRVSVEVSDEEVTAVTIYTLHG
jgi:cold shock CspA family protein